MWRIKKSTNLSKIYFVSFHFHLHRLSLGLAAERLCLRTEYESNGTLVYKSSNCYASKLTGGRRNSGDKTLWVSFTFVFTFKAQQQ